MLGTKIVSICIPTRNRDSILRSTLESIYKEKIPLYEFEVVIYDSSDNLDTKNLIHEYFNFDNLIYINGPNYGYLNLIEVLKFGKGKFLKLHNDYSEFIPGSLLKVIKFIGYNEPGKPVIFFSNNTIKSINLEEFDNLDSLLGKINYLCTWSTMFGIWKSDFDLNVSRTLNNMFPHTDLLLELYNKSKFIVNNDKIFKNTTIHGKGGYNLFYTFSVDFLNLLKDKVNDNKITLETFILIKNQLFKTFLVKWYCELIILPNKYTFEKVHIKKSILINYTYMNYITMCGLAYVKAFNVVFKRIITIVLSGKRK